VRISGTGGMRLDTETLDFTVTGKPKSPRLIRVQAPVLIRGTLEHPKIGIEPGKSLVQAGAAVALGVLATPFAAILAFVDPGLAKNADCATVLAEAKTDGAQSAAAR
jgi:AsmA family protein